MTATGAAAAISMGLQRGGQRAKAAWRSPASGRIARKAACALAAALLVAATPAAAAPADRAITVDDVLDLTRIDRVTLSPDGEWAAAIVQRPARPGEAHGRGIYDLDPSRGDLWLISRRTGERRNVTNGEANAAGFWCAAWSPDGRRIALLSTRPEAGEPRGGDNVRLYVWDRASDNLTRLHGGAMMTQTMGGSPLYRVDLRGGADRSTAAHRCSDQENAPFAWLDERTLLAVMLPDGAVSGLIDAQARPVRHAVETQRALRGGTEPTATAVGSGAARVPAAEQASSALIRTFDVESGAAPTIASVPLYPLRGELTLSIAPDRRRIAVLATIGAIPPERGVSNLHADDTWSVEKRLGFVDLAPDSPVRWPSAPAEAQFPLDLYEWSPDSRRVALRARARPETDSTPLFVASADDLAVARAGPGWMSVGGEQAGSAYPSERPAFWVDAEQLLVRAAGAGPAAGGAPRADWWLLTPGGEAVNLTADAAEPPAELRRSGDGGFVAIVGDRLMALDIAGRGLDPLLQLAGPSSIVWPVDPGREASGLLVADYSAGGDPRHQLVSLRGAPAASRPFVLPGNAQLLDVEPTRDLVLWREPTRQGLHLRETVAADGRSRTLLTLNRHLAAIDWGERRLIDYRGADGQALNGAILLPPGYRRGRHYPTLVWVYPGYRVRSIDDYWLDPYLGGIYNLHLYAARGYVVLVPSMPLADRRDPYVDIPDGVLPAVDRLIELGIADPDRLGVLGQSYGGYAVYALVTQTRRFRAAVAIAGFVDMTGLYTHFDATARNYPGIEHEKSANWSIMEASRLRSMVPPYEDYWLYWRNSPIHYVDRVATPLLMIHGEHDVRAQMSQAESFFYSLYRQGKTARLLRYWGENHGLSESPANVRSVFEESVRWFDTYLPAPADGTGDSPGH